VSPQPLRSVPASDEVSEETIRRCEQALAVVDANLDALEKIMEGGHGRQRSGTPAAHR
jgi:hypothetical protein